MYEGFNDSLNLKESASSHNDDDIDLIINLFKKRCVQAEDTKVIVEICKRLVTRYSTVKDSSKLLLNEMDHLACLEGLNKTIEVIKVSLISSLIFSRTKKHTSLSLSLVKKIFFLLYISLGTLYR